MLQAFFQCNLWRTCYQSESPSVAVVQADAQSQCNSVVTIVNKMLEVPKPFQSHLESRNDQYWYRVRGEKTGYFGHGDIHA
jgi:hypothetical protein